jgi:hypothetical protein
MEEWLDKVLSSLHLEINLRKEGHENIKKIKINQEKRQKKQTRYKGQG